MPNSSPGKIILLNGASSAGKSTLCQSLQTHLDEPFLQFSLDFFMFGGKVLPPRRERSGPFAWSNIRPHLFEGYYNCLPALATAGNNLVIDYIIETQQQLHSLVQKLEAYDVFFVGVRCPLPELERREQLRGDRGTGDAKRDYETVHTFSSYDMEIDSTREPDYNAHQIIAAWKARKRPSVFDIMAKALQQNTNNC
ncbi:chloramphenicol phosphotransferase [bacterium]|nr:MAG: chloramphenicol phosphotransferase [bacterium]